MNLRTAVGGQQRQIHLQVGIRQLQLRHVGFPAVDHQGAVVAKAALQVHRNIGSGVGGAGQLQFLAVQHQNIGIAIFRSHGSGGNECLAVPLALHCVDLLTEADIQLCGHTLGIVGRHSSQGDIRTGAVGPDRRLQFPGFQHRATGLYSLLQHQNIQVIGELIQLILHFSCCTNGKNGHDQGNNRANQRNNGDHIFLEHFKTSC